MDEKASTAAAPPENFISPDLQMLNNILKKAQGIKLEDEVRIILLCNDIKFYLVIIGASHKVQGNIPKSFC